MAERTGKHIVWAGVLWIALTIVAEALVLNVDLLPGVAAEEGRIVDSAFRLLTILATPVFTFVVAVLAYGMLRFRSRGRPEQDGPPLVARPLVVGAWLAITGALSVYVIVNPGLTGLAELRAHHGQPDLVVKVEGSRWQWKVTYPRFGVTTGQEMVLPVRQRVQFDVTAVDVVHSFWVPSFRMKIDAVPGMVTTIHATPTHTGTYEQDYNLRLTCAELCGLGHAMMSLPVRVVERPQFEAWIASVRTAAAPDAPLDQRIALVGAHAH